MGSRSRVSISIVPENMLNLDKLNSQFDINSIDLSQINKLLLEQQKIVKLVFLVGSLLMAWGIYNDHRVKDQGLHTQLTQAKEKLEAIKARDAAIQELNKYKSSIPKPLNVFDLIRLINNYAKIDNDTITSYIPTQSKDMGLYDLINVHFEVVSDDFRKMMLFLRKIESSEYPLRINSWSGRELDGGKVSFTIEINAVLIHP
jgi:hypothetical protein